jgi:hypothetical protein
MLSALMAPHKSQPILEGDAEQPLRATTLAICALLMFGIGLVIVAVYG